MANNIFCCEMMLQHKLNNIIFLAVALTFGISCEFRSSIAFETASLLGILLGFEDEQSVVVGLCIICRYALSVGLRYATGETLQISKQRTYPRL